MTRFIFFEGSRMYHFLTEDRTLACGISEDLFQFAASDPGELGLTRKSDTPPTTHSPCARCEAASPLPREAPPRAGAPLAAAESAIEAGDWVRVPAGKIGRVVGVMREKDKEDSGALFKLKFTDGSGSWHAGHNLRKLSYREVVGERDDLDAYARKP